MKNSSFVFYDKLNLVFLHLLYKICILIAVFFLINSSIQAQTCRKINPFEKGGIYWEVIASKKNVPLFRDKECNKSRKVPNKWLTFKSKYSVCDESDESVKISFEQDKYWVKKEDLLLTSKCLVTDSGIAVKASVVSYYGVESPEGKYFDSPHDNYGKGNKIGSVRWYDFYFVYDFYPKSAESIEDSEYVLLGKKYKFSIGAHEKGSRSAQKTLFGWFKTNNLMIWNTRLAFEPNLSEQSISEKANQGVYASIMSTRPSALRYSETSISTNDTKVSDDKNLIQSKSKLGYSDYRFPALQRVMQNSKSIYRIAFAGNLYGQRNISKQLGIVENIKNIEILFVVDGTYSMVPYLKKMPMAIKDAIKQISNGYGEDYSLKWGLALFRNSKDHQFKNGYHYFGKTKSADTFKKWIYSIKGKSEELKLLPEDMFFGTQSAIENCFSGEKKSIRIVFLISDVKGEERSKCTPELLGAYLNQASAHLITMNVGNTYEEEFRKQILRVIQSSNSSSSSFERRETNRFIEYSLKDTATTYTGIYLKVKSSAYYQSTIEDAIKQIVDEIDDNYQFKRFGDEPVGNQNFVFRMNFNREFQKLDFSNKTNKVKLYRGWIVNEHHKLLNDPFTPVILLSQEECYKLSTLTSFLVDKINSERPIEYVESFLDNLERAHTGEFELTEDIAKSIERVGGEIPMVSKLLKAFIEGRIPEVVPVNDSKKLNEFRIELSEKSERFNEIYSEMVNEKDKVFVIGEQRYRWVYLNELP